MIEVEMKFITPYEALGWYNKLFKLYGEPTPVREVDTYYYAPCGLRIREETSILGESAYLTVKGPLVSEVSKSREEANVKISDVKATKDALRLLGYREFIVVGKHRYVYNAGDAKIMLDVVGGLGTFIELEILTNDVEVGESLLKALADGLGLKDQIREGYAELCKRAWEWHCKNVHIRTAWTASGPVIWGM